MAVALRVPAQFEYRRTMLVRVASLGRLAAGVTCIVAFVSCSVGESVLEADGAKDGSTVQDGGSEGATVHDGALDFDAPAVEVRQVAAGFHHVCAVLSTGAVRCWGNNLSGQLGYGLSSERIGDDEALTSVGPIDVGGPTRHIAVGNHHTCALLQSGSLRCWGQNRPALGYGEVTIRFGPRIGDDEAPLVSPPIDFGVPVLQVAAGNEHTCALLESGAVRCWGDSSYGQLGYATTAITVTNSRLALAT